MPNQGWARAWTNGFLRGALYSNGLTIALGQNEFQAVKQPSTLWAIATHANTHVTQKLYHGAEAPRLRQGFDFVGKMQVGAQDIADALRDAEVNGTYFLYTPLDRRTDIFDATNGNSYLLTRPLASSILAVDESSHPTEILLDGVVDPSAANVAGQSVAAQATGVITIRYTPIYRVLALECTVSVPKFNAYDVDYRFSEVVRV